MIFLAANTQDGFGEHRDKKYCMFTIRYTAEFLMLWPIFLLEVLDILFRHVASFYQIPTDTKNQQVTDSVRNLIMGHVWIFQPNKIPNTNLKNNTKWITEHKTKLLLWPAILDEGMVSDLVSGVL